MTNLFCRVSREDLFGINQKKRDARKERPGADRFARENRVRTGSLSQNVGATSKHSTLVTQTLLLEEERWWEFI
jgi:hypothetical protein